VVGQVWHESGERGQRGAKAEVGRHAGTAGPHEEIAIFGALFAGRPRTYAKYSPRPTLLRLHPDRFSNAGKTILDPSMRTVQSPPELN